MGRAVGAESEREEHEDEDGEGHDLVATRTRERISMRRSLPATRTVSRHMGTSAERR